MTDTLALQRLLTWLSPAFPVGAFAYSSGLETAIATGRTIDAQSVRDWIAGSLSHGGLHNDAILMAQAWRVFADGPALAELAELALALISARERHEETLITGQAFRLAANAWPDPVLARLPAQCPYSIAVGAVAAAHGVALGPTLIAFLTAACHSQVSVAIRLVPLGQTDGLRIMAGLEPMVAARAELAQQAGLAQLGGIGYAADIAAMAHETLQPRIFRS